MRIEGDSSIESVIEEKGGIVNEIKNTEDLMDLYAAHRTLICDPHRARFTEDEVQTGQDYYLTLMGLAHYALSV